MQVTGHGQDSTRGAALSIPAAFGSTVQRQSFDEAKRVPASGSRSMQASHSTETRAGSDPGLSFMARNPSMEAGLSNNKNKVPLWEKRSLPGVHIDTNLFQSASGRSAAVDVQLGGAALASTQRGETPGGRAHSPGRQAHGRRGDTATFGEHLPPSSPMKKEVGHSVSSEALALRGCLTCRPSQGCNRLVGQQSQGSSSIGEQRQNNQTWGATPRTPASAPSFGAHAVNELYKTEMCRSWMETGTCRYGAKCQFAHGPEELRPLPRHPKYKTKVCKNFAENGSCPYGSRCRFIHERGRTGSFEGLEPELLAVVTAGSCATPRKLPIFQQLHHGIATDTVETKPEATAAKSDATSSSAVNLSAKRPSCDLASSDWGTLPSCEANDGLQPHPAAMLLQSTEASPTPVAQKRPGADVITSHSPDVAEDPLPWPALDPAPLYESKARDIQAAQYWSWWSGTNSPPTGRIPDASMESTSASFHASTRPGLGSAMNAYAVHCSPVTPANKASTSATDELLKSTSTTWGSARSLWTALSTASAPFSASAASSASSPSSSSSACLSASSSMNIAGFGRDATIFVETKSSQPNPGLFTGAMEQSSHGGNNTFTWIH